MRESPVALLSFFLTTHQIAVYEALSRVLESGRSVIRVITSREADRSRN